MQNFLDASNGRALKTLLATVLTLPVLYSCIPKKFGAQTLVYYDLNNDSIPDITYIIYNERTGKQDLVSALSNGTDYETNVISTLSGPICDLKFHDMNNDGSIDISYIVNGIAENPKLSGEDKRSGTEYRLEVLFNDGTGKHFSKPKVTHTFTSLPGTIY